MVNTVIAAGRDRGSVSQPCGYGRVSDPWWWLPRHPAGAGCAGSQSPRRLRWDAQHGCGGLVGAHPQRLDEGVAEGLP